ncbi:MAG: hypothetical protein Crog4KO_21030 [Crocinitomicaceae bacterium]
MRREVSSILTVVPKVLSITWLLMHLAVSHAQLDSIHWLPPITSESIASNAGAYEHSVYLSTPETTAFDVTVHTGTGTLIGTYSISNSSPYRLDLANGYNYLCMELDSVGSVQRDDGLIFTANQNFYVNYRVRSNAQGGSLTAKGRIAKGSDFHWGGVPMLGNNLNINAVLGIMATEDNTNITIDGYDSNCEFRLGSNASGITSNSINVQLDAGETFVLEAVNLVVAENLDGWIGAHITSDQDIVMNNGNLMGGVISGSGARDICFDQALPLSRLGEEHIVLRGNGIDATELVIVIATQDGTSVSTNGGAPAIVLNQGEHHIFDGSSYSAQNNMFIETNLPVYVYQVLAGSSNERTIGLNFIPPLNCLLPLAVDNISEIDMIRSTTYSGGATILTRSNATVTINGAAPSSSPQVVTGNADWVTYSESGLSGNISIVSDEPMAAGMFGASGDAGFAGYFSGFSERPTLEIESDQNCVPSTLTLINTADNIQWYFDNSVLSGETNQTTTAATEGSYFLTAGTNTCVDTSNILDFSCNSLPIELVSFELFCQNDAPVLYWTTASELNNDFFTIEGSNDGISFYQVHREEGQGNSFDLHTYSYQLKPSEHFEFYRLQQTDNDGVNEVFETISRQDCGSASHWQYLDGRFLLHNNKFSSVQLFNAMGALVFKEEITSNSFRFYPRVSGIYFIHYRLPSGDWRSNRIRVLKE